jgi:glycosyltransferase involved in cell wall biosynthesis
MSIRRCPRVLFIVHVAWAFISHRLPLAKAAQAAGFEVHVLTDVTSEDQVQTLKREGIVVHLTTLRRGSLDPFSDLRFLVHAISVIRKVSPTVVHNVTVKPVLYGTIAARVLGVPGIINAVPGLGYAFSDDSRWLLAHTLKIAYRLVLNSPRVYVIFQNEDDARELTAAGLVDPERCVLIPGSGVDLACYRPVAEDPTTIPLVVLPARMLRDKGVVEFATAARLLRARGCHARFVLAGPLDPPNPAALSAEEIAQLGVEAPLEWLGNVEDMVDLYRRAHIVCLPSYREGLPKCLIEACASGRAIVTTDVPGCRAAVTHKVNGLLVPPRNATVLADALQVLIENPTMRARFGAAGRARAEREFALSAIVAETMSLYARAARR